VRRWATSNVHDSLRVHRRHQCASHTKQHHPVPLRVDARFLLLSCNLLQVPNLLQPSNPPVDITMLVEFDAFVRGYRHRTRRGRWETHARGRHHREVGVEPRNAIIVRSAQVEQKAAELTEDKVGDRALVCWDLRHPDAWTAEHIVHADRQTRHLPGGNRRLPLLNCVLAWHFSISSFEYGARQCEDPHAR
jgi:5-methylcytosine-specific restriction endonuclease McrA